MKEQDVAHTTKDYIELERLLKISGYIEITREAQLERFRKYDIEPQKRIFGTETGFVLEGRNGYYAIVWTTYLKKHKKFRVRGTDAGRALIVKDDYVVYNARTINRSKGFILQLARYAWITMKKVKLLPTCPCKECGQYMEIDGNAEPRYYRYKCSRIDKHPDHKPRYRPWDYPLGPNEKEFVKKRRDNTKKYNETNKEKGINPTPIALVRKPWKKKKKEK